MNIKYKIIAEKYLENKKGENVYKVFYFNWIEESIKYLIDRKKHLKISFNDLNWKELNYVYIYPLNNDIAF